MSWGGGIAAFLAGIFMGLLHFLLYYRELLWPTWPLSCHLTTQVFWDRILLCHTRLLHSMHCCCYVVWFCFIEYLPVQPQSMWFPDVTSTWFDPLCLVLSCHVCCGLCFVLISTILHHWMQRLLYFGCCCLCVCFDVPCGHWWLWQDGLVCMFIVCHAGCWPGQWIVLRG